MVESSTKRGDNVREGKRVEDETFLHDQKRITMSSPTASTEIFKPFTGEKLRGMVISVLTGAGVTGLNVFGQSVMHLHPLVSTMLFLNVAGNLLVYSLDIIFAKSTFHGQTIPYTDYRTRLAWLGRSFLRPTFVKFIVTALIDGIILIEMLDYGIYVCDMYGIHFKFRNEAIAAVLSVVTFIFWVNALRFNWAYSDSEDAILNLLVMAWLGIVIMVFCATRTMRKWKQEEKDAIANGSTVYPPPYMPI